MGIDLKALNDLERFVPRQRALRLHEALVDEYERQKRQSLLWLPIFLSLGIGLYFALPTEPPLVLGGFATLSAFFMTALLRERYRTWPVIVLLVALGFFAAQLRTYIVHTPILQEELGPVMVQGTIAAVEDLGDGEGSRLVLSDLQIEDLEPDRTPVKLRLKIRDDEGLYVGQRVEALGKLHPPSPPVMPGGFDFQKYMYFRSIGAVGFIYRDIEVLEDVGAGTFSRRVEWLRQAVGQRIEQTVSYPGAGIAMALMIGRKTAIEEEDRDAMRAAGLAHMLAISGLHVGLLAGALFFAVRLGLAFVPGLALRYPVKKYAAVIAMLGALGYMFLAGASIPTQRAILMTGIVFLAIILDRSPISLRLVSFAAFMVLLVFPESLLSASFHMSFAAVTCLIAFYDWLRPYWSAWYSRAGILRRAGLYFLGVSLTTIIATIATAPFALFHFNQLAVYGILGNVLAMPLLAFVIMPSILLALVLIPFGLEFVPLYVTELGITGILDSAHWVAGLPHAVLRAAVWPQGALVGIVCAALIVILGRGYWRAAGILPLLISLIIISLYKQPDILASSSNKLIAVRGADGGLQVSGLTADRFTRESWMQAYGLEGDQVQKWPKEGRQGPVSCGEMACRIELGGYTISYLRQEQVAAAECAAADIVIATFPLYRLCGRDSRARLIDIYSAKDEGAHAIWLDEELTVRSAQDLRGSRPWSSENDL